MDYWTEINLVSMGYVEIFHFFKGLLDRNVCILITMNKCFQEFVTFFCIFHFIKF